MYTLQPQKQSRGCVNVFAAVGLVALGLLGLLGVIFVFGFMTIGSLSASSPTHQVVYKLTTDRHDGDGGRYCRYDFDTTYQMSGGSSQRKVDMCDNSGIAVVDQFTGSRGDFVYLSVQNDKQSARISCEIFVDGKLAYQTFSQGQYVIATCNGTIP